MHACMHTDRQTDRHSVVHLFVGSFIHLFFRSLIHSFVHSFIHSYIHTYKQTCRHADMQTCIHAYTHANTHTHTYTHTHTHTRSHTHTHTHTRSHTHTRTHSYTHTLIHSYAHKHILRMYSTMGIVSWLQAQELECHGWLHSSFSAAAARYWGCSIAVVPGSKVGLEWIRLIHVGEYYHHWQLYIEPLHSAFEHRQNLPECTLRISKTLGLVRWHKPLLQNTMLKPWRKLFHASGVSNSYAF